MNIELLRENWLWIGAFELAAAANLLISIAALMRSRKAMLMSIPAPDVRKAFTELIVVKMYPSDASRFAISAVRDSRAGFLALPDFTVKELEDFLRGSAGQGNPTKFISFANPATSLIVYPDTTPDGGLEVRVVYRADPRCGRWVSILI
jgi:hypothetical protein